jgi:hypothetical protein
VSREKLVFERSDVDSNKVECMCTIDYSDICNYIRRSVTKLNSLSKSVFFVFLVFSVIMVAGGQDTTRSSQETAGLGNGKQKLQDQKSSKQTDPSRQTGDSVDDQPNNQIHTLVTDFPFLKERSCGDTQFVHSGIRIANLPGKGRGLVVRKDRNARGTVVKNSEWW